MRTTDIYMNVLKPMRIDYVRFDASRVSYPSDIEKGCFTAIEIKSCYDDIYSGNGLNFILEDNLLITTKKTHDKLLTKENEQTKFGNFYAKTLKEHTILDKRNRVHVVFAFNKNNPEENLEDLDISEIDINDWYLRGGLTFNCYGNKKGVRVRSTSEMLFYMVRSNTDV